MKTAMVYFLFGLLAMLIILYVFAWGDLTGNKMLTGNLLKDLSKSFAYYIGWLPYWWLVILVGAIVLAFLFYGIRIGIDKIR